MGATHFSGPVVSVTGFSVGSDAAAPPPQILSGSGPPAGAAPKGSLYLNTAGSGTVNRAYINVDGSTNWTAIPTTA
jgi:hypothetical protein